MDQATLWLQFMQAVHDTVKPDSGEALQVVYPYKIWNWGGRDPVAYSTSFEQQQALNVVPSEPGQNMNAQSPLSGFDVGYKNWFDVLTVGDLEHDAHYQSLQDDVTEASNRLTKDVKDIQGVWQNQTGGTGVDFKTWLADPLNAGYKARLDDDGDDLEGKRQELSDYRSRIKGPVNDISEAFENAAFQGQVMDPASGKSVSVRLWQTNPASAWDYVYDLTGKNFGGDAKSGSGSSLVFTADSSRYDYEQFYGEGGFGGVDDFIFVEAGGSYKKVDWSKFSSSYRIRLEWQDLKTVEITPDGWYSGSNINTYGRGDNYATGFSAFRKGNNNFFFGPGGALARIYKAMVVMYRPSVTVEGVDAFASYLYERWQTEGGIGIGPFVFEAEATETREKASASSSGGAFTIKSNDNWPLILGYISGWTLTP